MAHLPDDDVAHEYIALSVAEGYTDQNVGRSVRSRYLRSKSHVAVNRYLLTSLLLNFLLAACLVSSKFNSGMKRISATDFGTYGFMITYLVHTY